MRKEEKGNISSNYNYIGLCSRCAIKKIKEGYDCVEISQKNEGEDHDSTKHKILNDHIIDFSNNVELDHS